MRKSRRDIEFHCRSCGEPLDAGSWVKMEVGYSEWCRSCWVDAGRGLGCGPGKPRHVAEEFSDGDSDFLEPE